MMVATEFSAQAQKEQQGMGVLISGLDEAACAALMTGAWPQAQLQWLAPEVFLQRAEGLGGGGDDAAVERWVWLYRPPWSIDHRAQPSALESADSSRGDLLGRWYRQQRAALAMRRVLGSRMLLVNAERIQGAELARELGLALPAPVPAQAETGADDETDASGQLSWFRREAMGQGLAKLFDWALPHYWDLFEDLEAAAWLPRGEPLFRQVLQPVSQEAMEQLLQLVRRGASAPRLHAHLREQASALASLQGLQRETVDALEHEQQNLASLQSRSDLRIRELEQALEQAVTAQANLSSEHDALQTRLQEREAEVAECQQALAQANTALDDARRATAESEQARAELSAREQALSEEQSRLSAELARLNDALDGQSVANRELRARLSRSTETLDRARIQLCRQLARQGASASERS